MHWFYVENSQITEKSITIVGDDVKHIRNVLRMNPGEHVVICDGQGKDYYCVLSAINKEEVIADILEINDTETELPAKIYLFQGIPKKDKMEFVIQKAVELGAYEIIPVAMKRCVAKIENEKKEKKKLERWQAISTSAAKQSGRGMIPSIHPVMTFQKALEKAKELDCAIVPYEQAEGILQSRETLREACKQKSIGIFIGPEGGFDAKEIEQALSCGFQTITLGKRILRTETAGLTILSVLMFELECQHQ